MIKVGDKFRRGPLCVYEVLSVDPPANVVVTKGGTLFDYDALMDFLKNNPDAKIKDSE